MPQTDTLRVNADVQRQVPNSYSLLLEGPAGGHALFWPDRVTNGGGSIGDCGYIDKGVFLCLFNVYESRPAFLPNLPALKPTDVKVQVRDNSDVVLRSSHKASLSFSTSLGGPGLPVLPDISPIDIVSDVTRTQEDFAFLAFAGAERDVAILQHLAKKVLMDWFVKCESEIRLSYRVDSVIVITETVRSAGWVGGVALRANSQVSGQVAVNVPGSSSVTMGVSSSQESQTGLVGTRGPPRSLRPWSKDLPREYTIVVGYIRVSWAARARHRIRIRMPWGRAMEDDTTTGDERTQPQNQQVGTLAIQSAVGNTVTSSQPTDDCAPDEMDDDIASGDHTRLSYILDRVLLESSGVHMVIGDWDLLNIYVERNGDIPDVSLVPYQTETRALEDGRTIAHVVKLGLVPYEEKDWDIQGTIRSDNANEGRQDERYEIRQALARRITTWDAPSIGGIDDLGDIILQGVFTVTRRQYEFDCCVVLFQKILVWYLNEPSRPPSAAPRSVLVASKADIDRTDGVTVDVKPRTTPELEGRVYLPNMTGTTAQQGHGGVWLLHLQWIEAVGRSHLTLHCNSKEQLEQWQSTVTNIFTSDPASASRHSRLCPTVLPSVLAVAHSDAPVIRVEPGDESVIPDADRPPMSKEQPASKIVATITTRSEQPAASRPRPGHISRARTSMSFTTMSGQTVERTPPETTTNSTKSSTFPPIEVLLSYLSPPLEPSLAHARRLAQLIPEADPLPPPMSFTPILASLLAQDRPPALQAAGADIVAVFPSSRLSDMERQIWATLLLNAPLVETVWSSETATRRLAALNALLSGGAQVLGLEPLLLNKLPMWIDAALDQRTKERGGFAEGVAKLLRATMPMEKIPSLFSGDRIASAEETKERTIFAESVAKLLCAAMTMETNRGLFSEADVVRVLAVLEGCVTAALEEPMRRPSSPTASAMRAYRQPNSEKQPSSLSQISTTPIPPATLHSPAKLYIDFFFAIQPLAYATYTTHSLRVVCRILGHYVVPLPSLSMLPLYHHDARQTQLNEQISELLLVLLDGRLTATVFRSLKLFLRETGDPIVALGSLHALRILLRHIVHRRMERSRAHVSPDSMTGVTMPSAQSDVDDFRSNPASGWRGEGLDLATVGDALAEATRHWVDFSEERCLEETAGLLADIASQADLRDRAVGWESDERAMYGKVLQELVRYASKASVTSEGAAQIPPNILPLSAADLPATTPFFSSLATLLSRPLNEYPPLEPSMSTILLSVPSNISDDTFSRIVAHLRSTSLTPSTDMWLHNFRSVVTAAGKSPGRRVDEAAEALRDMHEYLRDNELHDERRALIRFLLEHLSGERKMPLLDAALEVLKDDLIFDADPDAEVFSSLGEATLRLILKATRMSEGLVRSTARSVRSPPPPASTPVTSATMTSPRKEKEHPRSIRSFFGQLTTPRGKDSVRIDTATPALDAPSTSTAVPKPISSVPPLPASPSPTPVRLPSLHAPPSVQNCTACLASSALVQTITALAFAPRPAHWLVVRLYTECIALMAQHPQTCTRARLVVLSFMMRLRADWDHIVFLQDSQVVDDETKSFALLVGRTSPRRSQAQQRACGRPSELEQDFTDSPSQSRRAPLFDSSDPLWAVPEDVPLALRGELHRSEGVKTHIGGTDNDGSPVVLTCDYVAALTKLLTAGEEQDWDVLSYVLCHLPAQLANKHFFCDPKAQKETKMLLMALCNGIRSDAYRPPTGSGYKPRDANALAYHTLAVLVSYRSNFDERKVLDHLVDTFLFGFVPHSPTATPCLGALSLCVVELEDSITRQLSAIVSKLVQVASNTAMMVHVIGFLGFVASRPHLLANFTDEDHKTMSGIALHYLQVMHNRDEDDGSSWALSQHVLLYSYHVLYLWFLALPISKRRTHVPFITRQLLLANEGKQEIDERTAVCFDWLMRHTYASVDPKPNQSSLREHVMPPPDAQVVEKSWLFPTSLLTIRAVDNSGWIELDSRRASGRTCALLFIENVPLAGPGDFEDDLLSEVAVLMRNREPDSVSPALLTDEVALRESSPAVNVNLQGVSSTTSVSTVPKLDLTEGYVWAGSVQSQSRKTAAIDPGYIALQISPYPEGWQSTRNVTNAEGIERLIHALDRTPVIDTHAISVLYVAPGQTQETEILSNQHGSPAYTRFIAGIGRLIRLAGQRDVYTGSLVPEMHGEYAYAWWDNIGQILFHTATLMPNLESDPQRSYKKAPIGNDAVRIVWNDSGLRYDFDTISTEFRLVNIVIEPHSRGTVAAYSDNKHEHEYFRVSMQRAHDMVVFDTIAEFKIVSAESLPSFVRHLSLLADFYSRVHVATGRDRTRAELTTNWQHRLQMIKKFRARLPESVPPQGRSGEEVAMDFTLVF